MNILIITQSVDKKNQVLGFFHRWIEEFAKQFACVTVICLEKGEYSLPDNVGVFSLGKEYKASKLQLIFNFYKYVWGQRDRYDVVFVHMNPVYVILGSLLWFVLNKKVGLWYTHKHIDIKLRIATLLSDFIFTASEESFRLKTKKRYVLGHGIDTRLFCPRPHSMSYKIVTVGRIAETKKLIEIFRVFKKLKELNSAYTLTIIGDAILPGDFEYKQKLVDCFTNEGYTDSVVLLGSKSQSELATLLPSYDIFINMSHTGSVDKAVLEAAASGLYVVTSNEAFKNIFPHSYAEETINSVVEKILHIQNIQGEHTREIVVKNFDLNTLLQKIKKIYE